VPSLGDLWTICLRHIWVALFMAVVVMALVVWASRRVVPIYEADASLALNRSSKPVVFRADNESDTDQNFLNTQRDLLLSTPTMARAVASKVFKDAPAYAASGDPAGLLRSRLVVNVGRESSLVVVSLRDEDASRAEQGLAAVLDAFLARQEEQRGERTAKALSFLEKQVVEARERLDASRAKEQRFRESHAIISANPDDNYVAIRLRQYNTRRAELDTLLNADHALELQVAGAEAEPDPQARERALLRIEVIRLDAGIAERQRQLAELHDREVALAQRYLDRHPKLIEARTQYEAKRAEFAVALAAAVEAIKLKHQKLLTESQELDAEIARGEQALKEYRNNLNTLDLLSQGTQSEDRIYQQLVTRLNEERVTSQLQTNVLTVIDPPRAGGEAINIKPNTTIAVAALLSALAGVCAALVMHAFDRRVRGHAQVRDLTGLPLLGRIPFVEKLATLAPGANHVQHMDLAEGYRGLRTAIKMVFSGRSDCRCLAISSTAPGEGKTTVTAHLAVSLAATGARVLLIDADLRNPQVHRLLGETGTQGLAALLAGDAGVPGPRPTPYANLSLVPVGTRPSNPAELLHGRQLPEFIAAWRRTYDYIIIDTPPLGPVSDALVVGELADALMLVVRDRFTRKSELVQTLAAVAPLDDKVIGVILNGERGHHSKYGYPYLYSTANASAPQGQQIFGA
jgi:capsular exopolysaccharide synthesis family protein